MATRILRRNPPLWFPSRSTIPRTLTVPIYVSDNLFQGDWLPGVGEQVTGIAWMQAYAKALR
jgi:hypothetical protein